MGFTRAQCAWCRSARGTKQDAPRYAYARGIRERPVVIKRAGAFAIGARYSQSNIAIDVTSDGVSSPDPSRIGHSRWTDDFVLRVSGIHMWYLYSYVVFIGARCKYAPSMCMRAVYLTVRCL